MGSIELADRVVVVAQAAEFQGLLDVVQDPSQFYVGLGLALLLVLVQSRSDKLPRLARASLDWFLGIGSAWFFVAATAGERLAWWTAGSALFVVLSAWGIRSAAMAQSKERPGAQEATDVPMVPPPREGWTTTCEYEGSSGYQGRGVRLKVLGDGREEFAFFRCVVSGRGGTSSNEEIEKERRGLFGNRLPEFSSEGSCHYPADFTPKVSPPFPDGVYAAKWFAERADLGEPDQDVYLGGAAFEVLADGRIECREPVDTVWTKGQTLTAIGKEIRYGRMVLWEIEAHAAKWGRKGARRGAPWMEALEDHAALIRSWASGAQALLDQRVGEPHASLFTIETNHTPPLPSVVLESEMGDEEEWAMVWHRIKRLETVMESLNE